MQLLVLAALVAVATAGAPLAHGKVGIVAQDYYEPRPYHFQYAVDDPDYGPMMAQAEESNGNGLTEGYYTVNLPDGRIQNVKYIVDGYSGFNAEVSYAGLAAHPQVPKGIAQPVYGGHALRPIVGKALVAKPIIGKGIVGRPFLGH
ncbi:cuticle protein 19-like [Amphibalanus amphitrite]|uniref:cuticle protein 19-like n=1 Tax=Amphibalanus amphitrite TaxID=1232801 RepID=UPI001C91D7FF|nr:cuticle protein 19-like [Amphibalanus amphitrite]